MFITTRARCPAPPQSALMARVVTNPNEANARDRLDLPDAGPTAHGYCRSCFSPGTPGAVAICGHVSDGSHNPRAPLCVVCRDLVEAAKARCPKCGKR